MSDENSTSQERSESPTPRRKQQARDEGRIARSQELSAAVVLLAGTAALATVGGQSLAGFASRSFREGARALAGDPMGVSSGVGIVRGAATGMTVALLPFLLGLGTLVVLVNLLQTRGLVTWKPLEPKLSRVSPAAGLKRIFSPEAPFTLFKSVAKVLALACVAVWVMNGRWPELMSLSQSGTEQIGGVVRELLVRLAAITGLCFLALSLIDYAWQRYRTEKSLRMTKQEVSREFRETEGDPHVKARIRSVARARARQRMLQQVPTADVVVVNPTEIAAALKYDMDVASAPVVVALGQRKLAERIKVLAIESNVPVVENRPVARALLATATVGKPIPPALYAAVAEILAFVYRQRGGLPGMRNARRTA